MTAHKLFCCVGILGLFFLLIAVEVDASPAAERAPNVVVILADDLGWGSVGCYGADPKLVRTPNIDRLAVEGRKFTDANTTSSVCSPTRYSMLTGRYCWRTSLISEVLGTTSPLHIETDRLTISSMLKSHGYQCAAVGKWHLGYGSNSICDFTKELKPGPLELGFDYHFGVPANHGDISGVYVENHWVYGLNRQSPTSPSPPYVTMAERRGGPARALALNAPKRIDDEVMATLTDKVVDWIGKQTSETPFFVYFTPVAVHNPITPSKQTAGGSQGGPFCDFIHDLDLSVGRVLDALDQQGFAENTLVLFTSDNGGVNKPNGNTPQNVAIDAGLKPVGPFRGGKHDVWEGGFRVPYLVRWPGHIPAGTVCDETISLVDTLASVAGVIGQSLPPAADAAEDSHNVSPAWLGQEYQSPLRPDLIVHSADGNFAIRKGIWKWIEGVPAVDVRATSLKVRGDQMQRMLFDLSDDLSESTEVSVRYSDTVEQLEALLNRYRDGGYSRELPPPGARSTQTVASLPPITGEKLIELPLDALPPKPWTTAGSQSVARDGALWVKGAEKGTSLSGPLAITDGVIEFQIRLGDANRHSLRVHTADNEHNFRIVLSRSNLDIAINPPRGQADARAVTLGRQRLRFRPSEWQTVRLTFQGDTIIVQVAGVTLTAQNAVLAEPKERMYFIAFDGEVGLRNLVVAR